ncbi:uncharacterized protein [Halyomorpha halys]|uniref:uncharacterized protein isoform X2 n=1 Tax=Halyomorpha halys TaxID=286706 RepID=UPI0006D4DD18|nr:uncharacterized protein LOC106688072 isoform X2 [Halyomorpha halys]
MVQFFKFSGLIYFIWFAFFTKSEKDIDMLMKDKRLLDEKIKNISDALESIRVGFHSRKTPTTDRIRMSPIAEKIYFIPLGKIHLRKFIIDMTVDMNYLKNSVENETNNSGNLKATADVNAKLVDDEDSEQTVSRAVKKKDLSGHFEYFSPMFKINLKALPVGVQLYVPIHKFQSSMYQLQKDLFNCKNKTTRV